MLKEHRTTKRIIEIIELIAFSGGTEGFSLSELSVKIDAPKSSLLPILHTLENSNFLVYNPITLKYTLGRKLHQIGTTYIEKDNFYITTLSIMKSIVEECSESCHLAELQGSNVLYLLKVDSPENIRMFSAPGRKLPANSTALGKALIYKKSKDELLELFDNNFKKVTENTITDVDSLLANLKKVEEKGYAEEKEENSEFIQCIAVPIEKKGVPIKALSVAIPTFRYTDEKEKKIIQLLQDARKHIETIL